MDKDPSDQRRSNRFSFSKQPTPNQAQQNLAKFKQQLKSQITSVIQPKEVETPQQRGQRFLQRSGIVLTQEEEKVIRFGLADYYFVYEEEEILGEGCIGLVKKIRNRDTQHEYAVKIVKSGDEEIVKNMIIEFKNLQKLIHNNIVRMYEIYIDFNDSFCSTSTVCVVMEKINGKEMFEAIQSMGQYSESMAQSIFKKILDGINFLHLNYCCHRDLKPNNILCSDDGSEVKITDFNVSKFSDQYKEFSNLNKEGKIEMWTYTGTVAFSAPEIFSGGFYNEQVDMWSAGCILYTMLSGQLPFNAEYLNDLVDQITHCDYNFQAENWNNISEEAKDLIRNLLQYEPAKRLTPEQALNHEWFVGAVRKTTLKRDILIRNMKRLVSAKYDNSPLEIAKKIRARCFLFGAGEVWKRNSMGVIHNVNTQAVSEDLRKVKSFDLIGAGGGQQQQQKTSIQVMSEVDKPGVYTLTGIDFSSDEDDK